MGGSVLTPASRGTARGPEATQRAVARLRRRSLVVHFWRGGLPVVIGVALLGMGVWAGVKTVEGLTPASQGAGDIRMVGPEFHGQDKKGEPYTLTADSAARDPRHSERINMEKPHLIMNSQARGRLEVTALSGLYDEQSRLLNLWGGVTAVDGQGNHFVSPTARIDTINDRAEGHDGVVLNGPLGQASSSSYAVDDKAGHVLLSGNVHTRLIPHAGKN